MIYLPLLTRFLCCQSITRGHANADKILNAFNNNPKSIQGVCTLLNTSNDWCVRLPPLHRPSVSLIRVGSFILVLFRLKVSYHCYCY